jgi:hypothetical protein
MTELTDTALVPISPSAGEMALPDTLAARAEDYAAKALSDRSIAAYQPVHGLVRSPWPAGVAGFSGDAGCLRRRPRRRHQQRAAAGALDPEPNSCRDRLGSP